MKKIFILLTFLISAIVSFSQTYPPIQQSQGAPNTEVYSRGVYGSDSGYHFRYSFPDTSFANLGYLWRIPGLEIRVRDTIFMRNTATTAWLNIGSSGGGGGATTLQQAFDNGPNLTGSNTSSGGGTATLNWSQYGSYRIGARNLFLDVTGGDSMYMIGLGMQTDTTGGYGIPILNKVTGALRYINFNTITNAVPARSLQEVTDVGNTSTNGIFLLGLANYSLTTLGNIEYSDGGNYLVLQTPTSFAGNNYNVTLPLKSSVLVTTVNGSAPNSAGEVTISAGASSLQAVTNVGNITDTAIVNAANISYQTYGTVWQDAFARSSFGSNYATTGAGVTYTFPSSAYLNISGTANSNNDYFTRVTDSTNENKGSITTRIVVNSKSASTFGIYIGWQGINAVSTNHPVFGGVTLTTGSNNLFFLAETTPFTYNDPQTLTIAAGDTIDLTLSRVDWTYTISYFNFTGDVSRSISYTAVPQGSVLPFTPNGFSLPAFHTLGADIRVYNFSRISDESKNARNVFGYNSLQLGGNLTDVSQKMGYIACGGNHANVIFAAGGGSIGEYLYATYDEDLARYAAGGAENFWCEVSGNDSAFSRWNNFGKPALIAARDRWVAAGKRWIWMQPFPRNALNLRAVADTVTAIASRLGDPLVPIFDRFNVSNQLPSDFNAGDGVHLTPYANRYAGYYIDSLYPQYTRQSNTTGIAQAYTVNAQNINFTGLREFAYTASAQTYTLPPDFNYIRINPSSTLATLTIQLPTIVDTGHIYFINFGGQLTSGVVVTALTLSAGTGQVITRMPFVEPVGGVTPLNFGVGDLIICRYLRNGIWEATPIRTGYYTDLFIAGRRLGAGLNQATQDNTVFGYAAGNTLSSGTDNTFIGNQAGQLTSSGVRNSFYGNESGMNNSTGSNNTAFGEESLRQGNGTARTTFGYASCFNCTGSDVVAMGVNAMFGNTTGANNVGLGSGASQNNVTGSGNVAVGMNALFGVAANSHSNNTAVGLRAGTALTTGSANIFIGDSAAYTQTTGIRNIIIGTNITASAVSASLEMNIGGLLFGTGMTATGTSTAGNFGVATPAPSARLHLPAGTATASTAPLKFTSGTILSSIEAAAAEYNNAYYLSTNALNRLGVGGVIYSASDSVVNDGTNPTTLVTVTTKANTLAATNETIRTEIRGTLNDAASTATLSMTFAGTNILSIAPVATPTGWRIAVTITRTGASTAQAMVDFFDDLEFHNSVITQLTGLTFSNTNALVLTGTSSTAAARAIVRNQYRMYWEPAAAN